MSIVSTKPAICELTAKHTRLVTVMNKILARRVIALWLARRYFLVRYRRSAIVFLWVHFKPEVNIVVFILIFGHLARLPDHGLPYPVLVLSAGIAWQFFAGVFSEAGGSVVNNAALVQRIATRGIVVDKGRILFDGPINQALRRHLAGSVES